MCGFGYENFNCPRFSNIFFSNELKGEDQFQYGK